LVVHKRFSSQRSKNSLSSYGKVERAQTFSSLLWIGQRKRRNHPAPAHRNLARLPPAFPLKRHDNPRSFQSARSACRPRLPEARRIVKFGQAIAMIWQRWSDAAPAGLWFAYSVSWECALLPFERAVVLARGAEKP
jgi:hypothetical protein